MSDDFRTYLNAIGTMFQQASDYVRDGKGSPPWSQAFDPDNIRPDGLPWLGQIVGVQPEMQSQFEDPDIFTQRQRNRIKSHLGFQRGSAASMRAAAAYYLTGNQSVFFRERDGDPYTVTVITRTSETPDPDAVLRALMAQKPAGIILNFIVSEFRTFEETTALNQTFTTSQADWPTFNDRTGV